MHCVIIGQSDAHISSSSLAGVCEAALLSPVAGVSSVLQVIDKPPLVQATRMDQLPSHSNSHLSFTMSSLCGVTSSDGSLTGLTCLAIQNRSSVSSLSRFQSFGICSLRITLLHRGSRIGLLFAYMAPGADSYSDSNSAPAGYTHYGKFTSEYTHCSSSGFKL